ncbi:MAG: hypothetical protein K2Y07_12985 [Nitrosomonas sp.]|nr:hypothetical protein [Nitrosomonas sp.]
MHSGVDVDTGLRRYDGWRGEGCGGCNGMVIMVVAADLGLSYLRGVSA